MALQIRASDLEFRVSKKALIGPFTAHHSKDRPLAAFLINKTTTEVMSLRVRFSISSSVLVSLRHSSSPLHLSSQCLRRTQTYRAYSNAPSDPLLKVRTIPAPHTGLIKILSFASPTNKNAISRQFLRELDENITPIYNEWGVFKGIGNSRSAVLRDGEDVQQKDSAKTDTGMVRPHLRPEPVTKLGDGGALIPRDVPNSTRVLILSSDVAGVFCAGADLKERAGMSHKETEQFLVALRTALGRLACLPIPTISAISGFALGGGLELALATTFRVMSTTATAGLPEVRLGIIPGAGGARRLKSLIGNRRAADMILTGRRVGGREAFRMDLCERLVEEDQAQELDPSQRRVDTTLETAVEMATHICEGAPVAIGAALRVVGEGKGSTGLISNWENIMYERVMTTEDRNEALVAFKEKRKPIFKGR